MPQKPKIFKKGEQLYDVPTAEVESFLKEVPGAVEVNTYEKDGVTYDIPVNELDAFMQEVPGAKLIDGSKKKDSSPSSGTTQGVPGRSSMGLSPLPASVGESIIAGEPEKDPILKRAAEKSPWLAAPINFLTGAVKGTGAHIMKPLDGAQKLFYKAIGSLMELSPNPNTMAEGIKLKAQQDDPKHRTWFKNAEEGIDLYATNRLPEPDKGDFFSALVYNLGDLAPFMTSLVVTPNPSVVGIGMKLPINIAGQSAMSTYSDTGDLVEATKQGLIGLGDGAMLMMMGYGSGKASQWITKGLSNKIGAAAGVVGATSGAGLMYGGGVSTNISKQLITGRSWDQLNWDEANQEGALFFALGVPGIVNQAAQTYVNSPMETLAMARRIDTDVTTARKKVFEMLDKAEKEVDPQKKSEYLLAAESMNGLVNIKAMDEYLGKNSEQARKDIKESDIPDKQKKKLLEMVDEAELYQKQLEKTKDLATAEEKIKAAEAKREERPETGALKVEPTEGGKFKVTQEGTKEAPEFNTLEEAEKFKTNFETLIQGERTFAEEKRIVNEKVASGEAKKPDRTVTKVEPKTQEDAIQERKTEKVPVEVPPEAGKEVDGKVREQAAGGKEVPYVTPETSEKYSALTETTEGDYVFYHYSPERRTSIEPSKSGSNKGAITGKAEQAAAGTVGGLSYYYPNTAKVESGVGKEQHAVRVPKEKVYDGNKDPLGFAAEAEKQFRAKYPDMAFSPNHKMAWITKIAGENGYDMVVVDWAGGVRAQSTKPMTPEAEAPEATRTADMGWKAKPPVKAEDVYANALDEINKHQNKKGVYDELYHARSEYTNPKSKFYKNKEAITKLVEASDLPADLKAKYNEALEAKDVAGVSVKDAITEQVGTHKREGGSTYSVDGENLIGQKKTSVGMFPERTQKITGDLTAKHIEQFREKNKDILDGNEDILSIGTWYKSDTRESVLDIVATVPREKAVELGERYNQEAVFDLEKGEEISTGGTGKVPEGINSEADRVKEIRDILAGEPPATVPPKPPKPPEGQKELQEGEEPGKPEKSIVDVMKDVRKERTTAMKIRKAFSKLRPSYLFYDQQEVFKRAVLKAVAKMSEPDRLKAQRVIWRKNVEKGTKGRTENEFSKALRELTGGMLGLGPKHMDLISDINDMRRTKELYKSRDAFGKKQLLMEGGVTLKQAEEFLTRIKKGDPELLKLYGLKEIDAKKIMEVSDMFNEKYRDILDELRDNGILRQEAYDQIVFEHPYYSPRKFIEAMDKMDPGGSMSGVEGLKGGSEGAKVVDALSLYFDALSRKNAIIARTRTFRAMEDYIQTVNPKFMRLAEYSPEFLKKMGKAEKFPADKGEGSSSTNVELPGVGKPAEKQAWIEPQFKDTPKGMENLDYIDSKGNKRRIWIDAEVHKYFDIEPFGDLSRKIMNYAGWISGTKLLKMAATGYNPEFMVKNVPIDIMHILNVTDVYSPALPVAVAQIHADMATVAKDVMTRSGRVQDYINEGGSMKMLTGEGRLREGVSVHKLRTVNQFAQALEGLASWPGESSELITRIALRERHLNNAVERFKKEKGRRPTAEEQKEMQLDATAYSRNYLDFEQGGRLIKMADSVIPYLNAGFQVTRGSIRAAGKNPGLYAAKVAQLAGVASAITAWNMGMIQTKNIDEEKGTEMRQFYLNDISDEVKARNFILMTPLKYTDANNTEKYLYFKLQKDNFQELVTGVAEDRVHREVMGDAAPKYLSPRRLKELQVATESFANVSQLPPAIRGALGYKLNKDFFYNSELWMGYDMGRDKSLEFKRDTPARYKAVGKIPLPGGHKLSPIRTHYVAKQFFTESNVIATGIGEMMDMAISGASPELKTEYTPGKVEKLKNAPFARRFLKSTYPGASKQGSDTYQQEYNRLKQDHNHKLDALIDKEASSEEVFDWLDSIVDKGEGNITSIKEYERLSRRYQEEVLMPAVNSWVESLRYQDAIPRAQELFDQWVFMDDAMRDHLLESAAMAGVLSEATVVKLSELMDEYEKFQQEAEVDEAQETNQPNPKKNDQ